MGEEGQGVDKSLTDRLVHTQNQASSLHGGLDGINLDQTGLPHKGGHVIADTFVVKVHTSPDIVLAVLYAQTVENVCGVETSVVAKLAGNDLQGLGKRLDNGLLLVGDIAVGIAMQVARQLHLRGTTTGNNGGVTQSTLDDHDSVVQTALHLGNELLGTATQHQGAGLSSGAVGEYVEALSTNLALLEGSAGTEVALLDISAG